MIFKRGNYRHKKFMDVFVEVLNCPYQSDNYAKIKVLWWNINKFGKPFLIHLIHSNIKVYAKDYSEWERYDSGKSPQWEHHKGNEL